MRLFELQQEITDQDLNNLERYLDSIFSTVGIDVQFTKHFINRINDIRNLRPITIIELSKLFKEVYKVHGKRIAQHGPDFEGILSDISTNINVPFILNWDKDNEELDLVSKTIMRKDDFTSNDPTFKVGLTSKRVKEDELEEGLYDPNIFKAVFIVGGPGSGKSYFSDRVLSGRGLKTINSDQFFELIAKKQQFDLKKFPGTPKSLLYHNKAKASSKKQFSITSNERLGLIIDGTGRDYQRIKGTFDYLISIGYDCLLVFINTDLKTAIQRNQQRDRTVALNYLKKTHQEVQNNIGKLINLFGSDRSIVIDNSTDSDQHLPTVEKKVNAFLRKPVVSPTATAWIKDQQQQKDTR